MDRAIIGEIHTGLLLNSTAASPAQARRLLASTVGAVVWQSQRPIPATVSPDRLTGVDCGLPPVKGSVTRAVGTVATHTALTGGRILQSSTHATVVRAAGDRRQPWSHYLAHPATLEAVRAIAPDELAEAFLTHRGNATTLDLGAITGRALDLVHERSTSEGSGLDFQPPFKARRTTLRWALTDTPDEDPRVDLSIQTPTLRSLRLRMPSADLAAAVTLAETVALHDWLISTQQELLDRGLTRSGNFHDLAERLSPAVDLLHLWMPQARTSSAVAPLWAALDHAAGLSLQWTTAEQRIRDRLTLGTLSLLSQGRAAATGATGNGSDDD